MFAVYIFSKWLVIMYSTVIITSLNLLLYLCVQELSQCYGMYSYLNIYFTVSNIKMTPFKQKGCYVHLANLKVAWLYACNSCPCISFPFLFIKDHFKQNKMIMLIIFYHGHLYWEQNIIFFKVASVIFPDIFGWLKQGFQFVNIKWSHWGINMTESQMSAAYKSAGERTLINCWVMIPSILDSLVYDSSGVLVSLILRLE